MKRRGASGLWGFAALLLGVALAGCVVTAPEETGGALHRHNWWNYYARGQFFLKAGRREEAMDDFRRCLGEARGARFGNGRDMWRARTYGLHFVEGYFPNRELGVCLCEAGDFGAAVRYLETSLRQEPSGRAKHYLNVARQALVAGRAAVAPRVTFATAAAAAPTRERWLELAGRAEGEGYVRRVSVCGEPVYVELAERAVAFGRRVSLTEGTNVLSVEAEDLKGQRTVARLVRVADWQPPRLVVREVALRDGAWWLEGECRDVGGVVGVRADGREVYRASAGAGVLAPRVPLTLRVPAEGVALEASDMAGNRLACRLTPSDLALTARRPDAQGQGGGATLLERMEAWSGGGGGLRLVAAGGAPAGDRLRPSLSLKGCQGFSRVSAEEFFLDGIATDGGGLEAVTVNGEPLLASDERGAVRFYFARRLPLDAGTNRFEVAATDRAGNRTSETLTVERTTPEYLEERHRLGVGVPPLTAADSNPLGARVKRSLESELVREPVRFRLLERDEGWDFVLREQGLSVSDLADPSAALRIGKMVPADLLLMGRIFNESKGITVYVKVVETGDGEVVFASDVYTADVERGLDEAIAGLALKVEQGFPLLAGEVVKCQGRRVTLNVGRSAGALERSRFLVSAASVAGSTLCRVGEEPVQLQVERVYPETSTALVLPASADAVVKEGDHVYTR